MGGWYAHALTHGVGQRGRGCERQGREVKRPVFRTSSSKMCVMGQWQGRLAKSLTPMCAPNPSAAPPGVLVPGYWLIGDMSQAWVHSSARRQRQSPISARQGFPTRRQEHQHSVRHTSEHDSCGNGWSSCCLKGMSLECMQMAI